MYRIHRMKSSEKSGILWIMPILSIHVNCLFLSEYVAVFGNRYTSCGIYSVFPRRHPTLLSPSTRCPEGQ